MPTASEIGISGEKVTMRDAMKSRTRSPLSFCVGSFMTPWCPKNTLCGAWLAADGNERHETWLGQGIAPAMPRAVLDDAIPLAQLHDLAIVELERHFAAHHDAIVDGVGGVHPRRTAVEVPAHAWNLVVELRERRLERHAGGRLPSRRTARWIRDEAEVGAAGVRKITRLLQPRVRLRSRQLGDPLGRIQLVEREARVRVDLHDLGRNSARPEHRLARCIPPGQ